MHDIPFLLIFIVAVALAFDFTNGFHDTANAVATVISTRVLTPRVAILMCAVLNFAGALVSQNVAKTIAKGLVDAHAATQIVVLAAVLGAITWNLITWWFGIPSSSSHALIGGLVGATIVYAGVEHVIWKGIWAKVILPMVFSPIIGGFFGFLIMAAIYLFFAKSSSGFVSDLFRHLQRLSAALMAFSHGQNDAQKTMGIITLALVSFGTMHGGKDIHIPLWVVLSCATAMALGTASGGYRIIRTLGHRIIHLEPVNGFAAETAGSIVILGAGALGFPVSTTHVISGSIFGVGIAKRLAGVRWTVAQRMVAAWVITLPASGAVAGLCFWLLHAIPEGHAVSAVAAR